MGFGPEGDQDGMKGAPAPDGLSDAVGISILKASRRMRDFGPSFARRTQGFGRGFRRMQGRCFGKGGAKAKEAVFGLFVRCGEPPGPRP